MDARARLWLLASINVGTSVLLPLVGWAGSGGPDVHREWISVFVYTNVTAGPAVLAGPAIAEWLAVRGLPLVAAVVVTTLGFAAVGCLAAQALLYWTGTAVPAHFWREYFQTLSGVLLLSMMCAFGAFAYASLWERLRRAEAQLHEKAVAEERAQKLVAEARLRSLESRLHPHFLFNTLNSISALIAVDPARAEQIVGRLAALLRSSLDTSTRSLIPLGQELAMVEDYVDIERARFGDKLRGRVDVPAELRDVQVPPLSVQSLVENAVKHGITPQRGGGEICVSASADRDRLRIEVSDTGLGFDLAAVNAGHGLDSLAGRLDAIFSSRAHLNVSQRDGRCVVEMVVPRS